VASELAAPDELPPPNRSGEEIGRHIDEILSRPEFEEPPRTLYERIVDFVNELISETLGAVLGGGRGTVVGLVLLALLVATSVAVWVRFARTMSRDPDVRDTGATIDERRAARDWTSEADAAAVDGRWRDAMRCRYRALIARLSERGVVEEIPGRTAGEYRHELHRALPVAAGDFGRATELFELAWYGAAPTTPSDHDSFVELSQRVVASVPS